MSMDARGRVCTGLFTARGVHGVLRWWHLVEAVKTEVTRSRRRVKKGGEERKFSWQLCRAVGGFCDGRVQICIGVVEKEAERCDAISLPCTGVGVPTSPGDSPCVTPDAA